MRFRILTMLLAVLAVGVLLGLTHNQIREYFFPKPAVMSEREFWKVVEDARKHGTSDDKLYKGLIAELGKLSDVDIQRFAKRFSERKSHAYDMKLWSAVYLLNGGCGDDSFLDFRDYLVMMGEKDYARIVTDPDSLVECELTPQGIHFAEMGFSQTMFQLGRPQIDQLQNNIPELMKFYKHDLGNPGLKNKDFNQDDDEVLKKELPRIWNYLQSRKTAQ